MLQASALVLAVAAMQGPGTSAPNRRQTPTRPLPYEEIEVRLPATATSVELAGTLTHPHGEQALPAVILVQGGSPFDRDGTLAGHKPLFVLSDALTRAGFATLRLDDRGTGGSDGAKFDVTLEQLSHDLQECVRYLRGRKDVRGDRIGLLGHSGGALLGALVASRDPEIAFVVLLGCPALPLPELIAAQIAADDGDLPEVGARLGMAAAEIVRARRGAPDPTLLVQERWKELAATLSEADRPAAERFISSMSRSMPFLIGKAYLRDVYCLDPAPMLQGIRCPVLALWGEHDQGRKLPNASAWTMARRLAGGACSSFQIVQVPRTNHMLQTCETGAMDEVARIEETVSPAVLRTVVEWCRLAVER